MSKKNFADGLEALVSEFPQRPKKGRPTTTSRIVTNSSQEGTLDGEIRATFIVKIGTLNKLKAIAYWERQKIKTIFMEAMEQAVERYEKKNGAVKPIPKK